MLIENLASINSVLQILNYQMEYDLFITWSCKLTNILVLIVLFDGMQSSCVLSEQNFSLTFSLYLTSSLNSSVAFL